MDWLRLWHDMPTDPKFKTIAKESRQPLAIVLSVYLFLLVDGSKNSPRGHVSIKNEDIASGLDVDEDTVDIILGSMDGRLISDGYLTGWDKRQPDQTEDTTNNYRSNYRSNYIYYIVNRSNYDLKVATGSNPWARLKDLNNQNDGNYELLASLKCERIPIDDIYSLIDDERINGDWFKLSNRLNSLIENINSKNIKTADQILEFLNDRPFDGFFEVEKSKPATVVTTVATVAATKDKSRVEERREEKKKEYEYENNEFFKKLVELGVTKENADGWIGFRKSKKAPLSNIVINKFVKVIGSIGMDINEAIEHWIFTGHQGFYPPKNNTGFSRPSKADILKKNTGGASPELMERLRRRAHQGDDITF